VAIPCSRLAHRRCGSNLLHCGISVASVVGIMSLMGQKQSPRPVPGGDRCSTISGRQKLRLFEKFHGDRLKRPRRKPAGALFRGGRYLSPPDSESWRAPRAWRSSFLGLVESPAKHALEPITGRRRFKVFVLIPLAINWIHRMSWIGCDVDQVPTHVGSVGHFARSPA